MKTLLKSFFLDNWQRKLISVLLAVIVWFMVNQSLITSRTISNVNVRVVNIPKGKTVVDLQSNGVLTKRVTLTLVGNKTLLDELTSNDLEVVFDAQNKPENWIASFDKQNLVSLNPNINLSKGITRISSSSIIIRFTKLVSEKIPVYITKPIGDAPKGYQFLDIWPYQLNQNVSGPEEVIKRLKKGARLTLDLSNITKAELDALRSQPDSSRGDEVTFFVPDAWKRISIPLLSDTPIELDDPRAKDLRIDFVRMSLIPISSKIPISLYFPTDTLKTYNPKTVSMGSSSLVKQTNNVSMIVEPLFAKGVSSRFVRVVEQMLQLNITVDPTKESKILSWSPAFINPRLLEDRYISLEMSDVPDEDVRKLQPLVREEYLRNRFRSYMNRFQFYKADDKRFDLNINLDANNKIILEEGAQPLQHTNTLKKE